MSYIAWMIKRSGRAACECLRICDDARVAINYS